jgi:hypothetical protein
MLRYPAVLLQYPAVPLGGTPQYPGLCKNFATRLRCVWVRSRMTQRECTGTRNMGTNNRSDGTNQRSMAMRRAQGCGAPCGRARSTRPRQTGWWRLSTWVRMLHTRTQALARANNEHARTHAGHVRTQRHHDSHARTHGRSPFTPTLTHGRVQSQSPHASLHATAHPHSLQARRRTPSPYAGMTSASPLPPPHAFATFGRSAICLGTPRQHLPRRLHRTAPPC